MTIEPQYAQPVEPEVTPEPPRQDYDAPLEDFELKWLTDLQPIVHEHMPDVFPTITQPKLYAKPDLGRSMLHRHGTPPSDPYQSHRVFAETKEGWHLRINPSHVLVNDYWQGNADGFVMNDIPLLFEDIVPTMIIRPNVPYERIIHRAYRALPPEVQNLRDEHRQARLGQYAIPSMNNNELPIFVDDIFAGTLVRRATLTKVEQYMFFMHGNPWHCGGVDPATFPIEYMTVFFGAVSKAVEIMRAEMGKPASSPTPYILKESAEVQAQCGISHTYNLFDIRIQELKDEIKNTERHLRDAQRQAISYAAQLPDKRAVLEAFSNDSGQILDVSTITHPLVDYLYINTQNQQLCVYTKDIYCMPDEIGQADVTAPGFNLGSYQIVIELVAGRTGDPVRFYRQRGTCDAYSSEANHPHVFDSGDPCFGGFGDGVAVAMDHGDYANLIDICILFLQQANSDDDAGRFWPTFMYDDGCKYYLNEEGYVEEYQSEEH